MVIVLFIIYQCWCCQSLPGYVPDQIIDRHKDCYVWRQIVVSCLEIVRMQNLIHHENDNVDTILFMMNI